MNKEEGEVCEKSSERSENSVLNELNSDEVNNTDLATNQNPDDQGWRDKYLRLLAEFDNYKKHVSQQIYEIRKYEGENIFREIIDIIDDLERALSYSSDEEIKNHPVLRGVDLTLKNLNRIFEKFGLQSKSVLNQKFDPNTMEAIQRVEVEKNKDGYVINEFKKLYLFKDRILRCATVAVGVGIDAENETTNKRETTNPEGS